MKTETDGFSEFGSGGFEHVMEDRIRSNRVTLETRVAKMSPMDVSASLTAS